MSIPRVVLWLSHFGFHPCSGRILFAKTVHFKFLLWIFCSFKTVLKFLFKGLTKKLVLVRLHSTLDPVLFLKLDGTISSLVHWE